VHCHNTYSANVPFSHAVSGLWKFGVTDDDEARDNGDTTEHPIVNNLSKRIWKGGANRDDVALPHR
jgi:hypothetical protein